MNILLIITPFSPAQTPNTLRWIPLINFLETNGHNVTVLTTKWSVTIDDDQKVFRVGHNTLQDYVSDIKSSKSRRGVTGNVPSAQLSPLKNLVEKIIDKTWRNRYWPDGSTLFLKPGIKKGEELIQTKKISHIISVGLPFTCHLIAQALKEKNANLHWHMDIEDPFSYSKEFWVNNYNKYQNRNTAAEHATFKLADSINVTNDRAKEKYNDLFAVSKNKTKVIPPLFADYNETDSLELLLSKDKLHLAFFGTFYEGVRSPEPFLHFLSSLKKEKTVLSSSLQFHFFGLQNKFSLPLFAAFPELKDQLIFHGFVNRDQAISAMKEMDVLLNFGNKTDYHLPSKVVDYLYLKKPIINFTAVNNDSSENFFSNYHDILNLRLEKPFSKSTESFSHFLSKKRAKVQPNKKDLASYSANAIGDLYLKALAGK